jgi:hypothetical protein
MNVAFLKPVIALVLWTFVMWTWMYATRLPAIFAARMKLDPLAPRGAQMNELPPRVRWKADNYNHLFEMPTIFYATALVHAGLGPAHDLDVGLAWAYVGLRVAHSIWQSTVNQIQVRFAIFTLSSLTLAALAVHAALRLFAH